MSTIFLVRHAQSAWNGRFCGSSDPPLSPVGEQQARELAAKLAGLSLRHVYCSPLQRAVMTAKAINQTGAIPLTLIDGLREIDFGQWEGLTWREIEARDPDYARQWMLQFPHLTIPGGEPFAAFCQRVESAFHQIQSEVTRNSWEAAAVVAHGGVLRVLLATTQGQSFSAVPMPAPGEIYEIKI
jgi:broad specificity phosphatase PhoE